MRRIRGCIRWLCAQPPELEPPSPHRAELAELLQHSPDSIAEDILAACRRLETSRRFGGLPPELSKLVGELEHNAARLKAALGEAGEASRSTSCSAGLDLPWPRPLSEEIREWEERCPCGGELLRTQVCVAAPAGCDAWIVGRIFVGEAGLIFEGADGAAESGQVLHTGLMQWQDIVRWEEICDSEGEAAQDLYDVVVYLRGDYAVKGLRLQLGFEEDCKIMHDAWRLLRRGPRVQCDGGGGGGGSPTTTTDQTTDTDTQDRFMTGRGSSASLVQYSFAHSGYSLFAACDQVHAAGDWRASKPAASGHLPGVTLAQVQTTLQLEEGGPLYDFLVSSTCAMDIRRTRWARQHQKPGTLVRKLEFKIPCPPDVPGAMCRLVGLPKVFDTTVVVRLTCTDNELMLVINSCSLTAPYGDYFRVQNVFVFVPSQKKGVDISNYYQVVWVKPLPFVYNGGKKFMETKLTREAVQKFPAFKAMLAEYMHGSKAGGRAPV